MINPLLQQQQALGLTGDSTAQVSIPQGTTEKPPLRLTADGLLAIPLDGALEYDGNHLYFTIGSQRLQLDRQAGPAAFTVDSFVPPGTKEVGDTLNNPSFTATYSEPPTTASVIDNQGGLAQNVIATPNAFAYLASYTKTVNNTAVNFTLTASNGVSSDSKTTSVYWMPRAFWGVGPDGLSTEADIEGLANSALASGKSRIITLSPGVGEHIYYAYPASYGEAEFFVDGWPGGFDLISATISVTNGFGVTQNYRLYRSTNANLGTTTVQIV